MATEVFEDYFEHTNTDYPIGVYYIDLSNMFMQRVRPQWHDEMEIDLVREGQAVFSVGEEEVTVSAGAAVWINQNHLHAIRPTGDAKCVILSFLFHPSYLFEDGSFLSAKYFAPLTENTDFTHLVLDRSDAYGRRGLECVDGVLEVNLNKAYGYELETKGMLCRLWLQLLEKSASAQRHISTRALLDEERVKNAMLFIQSHYQEALTLDHIAESIHVSKSECCRCFKRTTGEAPFDHLLTYRIFESARRMQRADVSADSIQTLAQAAGFHNASYYNRIFRKYLNCTPTQYREAIKKSHRDALNPYGISLARL
ncbi:MAG: helix-turn-helix transcriptional regulator [Lachnospiraceae bacterium]|nr:helix-turn-helix transcriptional regulator [Lachnospiraceae bacterium]